MDFLLILLGILVIPIGFYRPNEASVPPWLRRSIFFALGAALILLGILIRIHRYG